MVFSYQEEWNYAICKEMDGPVNDPAEWNKPDSERQLLNVFSDIEDERVEGALSQKMMSQWNDFE